MVDVDAKVGGGGFYKDLVLSFERMNAKLSGLELPAPMPHKSRTEQQATVWRRDLSGAVWAANDPPAGRRYRLYVERLTVFEGSAAGYDVKLELDYKGSTDRGYLLDAARPGRKAGAISVIPGRSISFDKQQFYFDVSLPLEKVEIQVLPSEHSGSYIKRLFRIPDDSFVIPSEKLKLGARIDLRGSKSKGEVTIRLEEHPRVDRGSGPVLRTTLSAMPLGLMCEPCK